MPMLGHVPRQVTDGEAFHGQSDRLPTRPRLLPPGFPRCVTDPSLAAAGISNWMLGGPRGAAVRLG